MDQGYAASRGGHFLRLLLIFFGAVLGFVLIGLLFGGSSASADDGGSDDGLASRASGLVAGVTEPAGTVIAAAGQAVAATTSPITQAVADVAPRIDTPAVSEAVDAGAAVTDMAPTASIVSPLSSAIDGELQKQLGSTVVLDIVGTTPVASLLEPVTGLIDTTLETVGDVVAPAVAGLLPAVHATNAGASMAASIATSALPLPSPALAAGVAKGLWTIDTGGPPGPGDTGMSIVSSVYLAPLSAVVVGGFVVLLFSLRLRLVDSAAPASPVYETDSSPD